MLLVMISPFSVLTYLHTCSVHESEGKVWKFAIAAAHKIDIFVQPLAVYGPKTNVDGHVVIMECFLRDL